MTLSVTVSPSLNRKMGAGTEPLIAVAIRSFPVKLIILLHYIANAMELYCITEAMQCR